MKYCINFFRQSKAKDKADELKIKYYERNIDVIEFANKIPANQRLILDVTQHPKITDDLDILGEIKKKEFALMLSPQQSFVNIYLYDMNINYFYSTIVDRWDRLTAFIRDGVSDVYIGNELGFDLENVSKVCKKNNVQVRVYPNVAQSSSTSTRIKPIEKFFLRPEDAVICNKYIDVLEFFGDNLKKQDVLYEIYHDSHHWLGNLRHLILGFDYDLYSAHLVPYFGDSRARCKKKCFYGDCALCSRMIDLAKALGDEGVYLILREDKEYPGQEAALLDAESSRVLDADEHI